MIAIMFIFLSEELGIICSGLSVRLLQESSTLKENITLRQYPSVRDVFTIVTVKTDLGCDIMQSGLPYIYSGQPCAVSSAILQSFLLLFPLGSSI